MPGDLHSLVPDLERSYTDIHSHPELSMQETRTAGIAADRLRAVGYEVTTGIGKTGVVGLLRNGDGPTVMLRADMDALAALAGAIVVVAGHLLQVSPIASTIVGGLLCFALRYMAIRHGWHLPTARPTQISAGESGAAGTRREGRDT